MTAALGVAVAGSVIALGLTAWIWWETRHDRRERDGMF